MDLKVFENKEYELQVLGSILVDKETLKEVASLLSPDDFAYQQVGEAFAAAKRLFLAGSPVDIVTLHDAYKGISLSDLAKMAAAAVAPANAVFYAKKIKELSAMRLAQKKILEADEALKNEDIEKVRELAFELSRISTVDKKKAFSDMFTEEELERLASIKRWKTKSLGVITNVLPFQLGEEIVIAGKTSTGKTQLALNLAMEFLEAGATVAYVSLEVVKYRFLQRLILYEVGTDKANSIKLSDVDLADPHWQQLGLGILKEQKKYQRFHFTDEISDIGDIVSWAIGIGADILIIDYLQLIKNKNINGFDKYRTITSVVEKIRTELTRDMCVVLLSQLNRTHLDEPDNSQLSGSGSIEQTATGIVFIERNNENPFRFRVKVMKNQSEGVLTDWKELQLKRNGHFYEPNFYE